MNKKENGIFLLYALLALSVGVLIANLFFLPLFLGVLNAALFLGIAITLTKIFAKLARLKTETTLKTSELTTIIENIKDGALIYAQNFTILAINKAGEEILGISKQEIINKRVEPVLLKSPHFKILAQIVFPSLAPTARQISQGGWPQIVDITIEDPPRQFRTVLNRVLDEDGQVLGFLKLIQDLTREKGIAQSKEEFITIASHQLRTPLTAINWSFDHLLKNLGESKPELKEIINEGLHLSSHALKIINDLLDATKMEHGQFGYNFGETELSEFIEEVIAQIRPIAKKNQIKLIFEPPVKKLIVRIDTERLGIALFNLIDNAVRYNVKNGEVRISVEPLANRSLVKISVSDTGVGIPSEDLGRLFTKFYRGSGTSLAPNGSGLGLYITKNIIQAHGGNIIADSAPGRGSVFSFAIPLMSGMTTK